VIIAVEKQDDIMRVVFIKEFLGESMVVQKEYISTFNSLYEIHPPPPLFGLIDRAPYSCIPLSILSMRFRALFGLWRPFLGILFLLGWIIPDSGIRI